MQFRKLYEMYCKENVGDNSSAILTFVEFEKQAKEILEHCESIDFNVPGEGEGVLYYFLREEEGTQICTVPVIGYCASNGKVLSKMFQALADKVLKNGKTVFQIHLYAHDYEAQRLFSMLQFGFMSEYGVRRPDEVAVCRERKHRIETLSKEAVRENWTEIWAMTKAIIDTLQHSPVFYPGKEFTEEGYREFFLDEETKLHVAYDDAGRMIGMIETNAEGIGLVSENTVTANIGEIYVFPEYRGTGLSGELLQYAIDFEQKNGCRYLWVQHGTANRAASEFWNKYFRTYRFEMVREIEVEEG